MTEFKTIGELDVVTTLSDSDKFIVETLTGTKAVTRSALREEAQTITKADIGLGNVDNTSDANKPISTATQAALDGKVSSSTFSTFVSTTAPSTYLTQSDAASIYLTQNNASGTYLSKSLAASSYLSIESASNTYLTTAAAASTYATPADVVSGITSSTISALTTTAKTVSGAINEINGTLSGVETLLAAI